MAQQRRCLGPQRADQALFDRKQRRRGFPIANGASKHGVRLIALALMMMAHREPEAGHRGRRRWSFRGSRRDIFDGLTVLPQIELNAAQLTAIDVVVWMALYGLLGNCQRCVGKSGNDATIFARWPASGGSIRSKCTTIAPAYWTFILNSFSLGHRDVGLPWNLAASMTLFQTRAGSLSWQRKTPKKPIANPARP